MSAPSVAIVHYHLRRGGVTSVIKHALEACRRKGMRAVVVSGEAPPENDFPAPVLVVPSLAYGEADEAPSSPTAYAGEIAGLAAAELGVKPDLWHIHNHSLGKNPHLPCLAIGLAKHGARLVLQPHDFAEDGRPENYRLLKGCHRLSDGTSLATSLYPQGGNVHYALINGRDRRFLAASGVPPEQLHLLANAVALPETDGDDRPPAPADDGLIVYPTRAIRRKNLGELLFLAALDTAGWRYAVTLAPRNPAEKPLYERWVELADRLRLPVEFELGKRSPLPFPKLLKTARGAVTTSVAEGFGLAFLEPCLLDVPLAGRDLPEITSDFKQVGIDFGGLYQRLPIPLEWVDEKTLRNKLAKSLQASFATYDREATAENLQAAWQAMVDQGCVDFGRCDIDSQALVVERLAKSATAKAELAALSLDFKRARKAVANNRKIVERRFSLSSYSENLHHLYVQALATPTTQLPPVDSQKLLDCFLSPERFSLLRG